MKVKHGIVLLLLLVLGSMSLTNAAATNAAPVDSAGVHWITRQLRVTAEPTAEPTAAATADPNATPTADQLQTAYLNAWQVINATYYNPQILAQKNFASWEHKFDGKLTNLAELQIALKEMAASIGDHWTSYTPREELQTQYDQAQNGLVDLGLFLQQQSNGAWKVWYVAYGSPAFTADIRRGDIISAIGSTTINKLTSQDEVDSLLLAQKGADVVFTDTHNGTTQSITVTADDTPAAAIVTHMYANGTAYIRFDNFDDQTLFQNFIDQLGQMYNPKAPFKKLVIDLRGNPGGLVDEAVSFISLFMKQGVVMKETTRTGRVMTTSNLTIAAPQIENATIADFVRYIESVPLYVLVDENSASAAEITTAAFKDNRRATIIGETTFGKGVGYVDYDQQTGPLTIFLPGLLQITTLGLTTPGGYDVQGIGIAPNVFISQPRGHTTDVQLQQSLDYISAH